MASKRFLEMFLDFLMMLNPESSLPNSIFEFLKIKSTEDQGSVATSNDKTTLNDKISLSVRLMI